ncbi:MAG: hypothetical protein N3F65_04655 [Nitrososphaeria archaeon]|nr:hypothetical protein [Nitrososphaeria archaeon]
MLKALLITMLITLIASVPSSATADRGLILGYTNNVFLPFLSNSTLEFQLGEELWARAIGAGAEVILRSPKGLEEVHELHAGELKLLKKFERESDIGRWSLELVNEGVMHLVVMNPEAEPLMIRYDMSGSNVLMRLEGSPNAVFIDEEGLDRLLLIAGEANKLNSSHVLGENITDDYWGEVVLEVLSENQIPYEGSLDDVSYHVEYDPLIMKAVTKLENGSFYVNIPGIHEVGVGGLLPLRVGGAVLRMWLNESHRIIKQVYIVDDRFAEFGGIMADRMVSIPLIHVLNKSIKVLGAFDDEIEIIELTIPIAQIMVLDTCGNPLTNASIVANNPIKMLNGTAYILLRDEEDLPAFLNYSITSPIVVYVNGFRADSFEMDLRSGGTYNITLMLNRLTVRVLPPGNELPKDLILTINGTSFKHENGSCSYLLPPNDYLIEAKARGFLGTAKINLSRDLTVELKLQKTMSLEDFLKISAAIELAFLALLAYLNYRSMK